MIISLVSNFFIQRSDFPSDDFSARIDSKQPRGTGSVTCEMAHDELPFGNLWLRVFLYISGHICKFQREKQLILRSGQNGPCRGSTNESTWGGRRKGLRNKKKQKKPDRSE